MFKHVSFGVIGSKHVELLRQYFRVEPIDELAFPFIHIVSHPLVLMQPYFYPLQKFEKKIARNLYRISGMIGVDVADSDHITSYAVHLTQYAKAIIVPSNFARKSYLNSGVKVPVHIVPHGVDIEFIDAPKQPPLIFKPINDLKQKTNSKLITCWILHSEYRKGLDILIEYYRRLRNERKDVLLCLRTAGGIDIIEDVNEANNPKKISTLPIKWLTEQQKMELFDVCDLYFLSSRGGAFEHPPLEALARGEIVLGAKGGAWEDYLPDWALIPSRKSGQVLPNNEIHDGCGVEVLIDKAVDKTIEIFNNMDEYKARVQEHIDTCVKQNFTWEKIGLQLKNVVQKYL